MFERSRKGENALLIQPHAGPLDESVLEEFQELARSAGATVATVVTARIDRPNAATLIGSGKLEEVLAAAEASGADLILVNHTLSPGQERNLERALQRRVVDRTGLILDIFAQRARSHEGKLQVELAQLKHMATRLVRGWTHLERQRGGAIGLRGPGETQLETDRRLLQKRLEQLSKKLDKVEVQRTQMRRARMKGELPRVALVGYTNAGKSTLFNALTGAEAYADDKLFATLDPTVRRIDLPGCSVVLADTVGFVRDLPHDLVAAFRSTLSEARDADLLLHVVDAADPLRTERIAQVDAVLKEIEASDIPQLLVFNKIDRLEDTAPRYDRFVEERPRVWISARDSLGLDLLGEAIGQVLGLERVTGRIHLPSMAARLRGQLYELGAVRAERVEEDGWWLDVDMAHAEASRMAAGPGGHALMPLLPPDVEPPLG
ncbi:ribosome rescue GTPase HflX [Cognatilysobacter lacus]|uniref:GTPase HflX n=1 Tax=Cognatilysobacter lacus TaxID=1643323 RepID=A0A5D8Z9L6_9GAMM|nr:ribosome rescue GTPase HflX [Lysobacter lacus]TZF91330.1 GTPase HflX [Lysobacter lacus]